MARRKHSIKDLSLQTTSANPLHSFPSSQDLNPANDVSQRCDSLNRDTSSSIFEMEPADPALEALGSRVHLSSRNTPPLSKNWSTSYLNENASPDFGTQWSPSFYPLQYEYLHGQSQFPRLQTQNDAISYLNPLPADPALAPWNAIGYNPFRTENVLVGTPGAQFYERDYHAHPAVQESDSSGISSLSSSYLYNCPESQPFAIGHDLPSHVPWSRPNTVEENLSGNLPWIHAPWPSAQPMSNPFSERAVSGTQVRSRSYLWIGRTPFQKKRFSSRNHTSTNFSHQTSGSALPLLILRMPHHQILLSMDIKLSGTAQMGRR